MTPDEIDQLQRLVPSDSDAAHALWQARQEAETETTHCCDRCDHANEQEAEAVLDDVDVVLAQPAPTPLAAEFAAAWRRAPVGGDAMVAEFWYRLGRLAGHDAALESHTLDLREMMRAAKERL